MLPYLANRKKNSIKIKKNIYDLIVINKSQLLSKERKVEKEMKFLLVKI